MSNLALVYVQPIRVTDLFFTQISGRYFLPELCGEVHTETVPLQAV